MLNSGQLLGFRLLPTKYQNCFCHSYLNNPGSTEEETEAQEGKMHMTCSSSHSYVLKSQNLNPSVLSPELRHFSTHQGVSGVTALDGKLLRAGLLSQGPFKP